jgi:hypothetical protein
MMVYAALIDMGRNPALIPAATGLIFFKTVYEASNGIPRDGSGNGRVDPSRDGDQDGRPKRRSP